MGGIIPEPSEEGAVSHLPESAEPRVCRLPDLRPRLDDEPVHPRGGLLPQSPYRAAALSSRLRAAWTARRDFPVGRVMPYERRGTFTLMGRRRTPALKGV